MMKDGISYEIEKNVVIRYRYPRPYSRIVEVVDADSGEVLFSRWDDDIEQALAHGESIVHGEFVIRADRPPGSDATCYSVENEGFALCAWKAGEKRQRKRGGKKNWVKLHPERVAALDDKAALALLRLSGNINSRGVLVDAKRRRPLSAEGIGKVLGLGRTEAYDRIRLLKEAGVISYEDGRYIVGKAYLEKV